MKVKATFLTLYEYAVPDLSLLKINMFQDTPEDRWLE